MSAIRIVADGRAATRAMTPLAVNASGAAALCGVSRSMWLKLSSQGAVPAPVRLGRRTLWRVADLDAWLAAGCPSAERWREMSGGEA